MNEPGHHRAMTEGRREPTDVEAVIGEFKITYLAEDAARWFKRLGLPWNPPEAVFRQRWPGHRFEGFPDATDASRVWLWAATDNLRVAACTAVESAEGMAAARPRGQIQ